MMPLSGLPQRRKPAECGTRLSETLTKEASSTTARLEFIIHY